MQLQTTSNLSLYNFNFQDKKEHQSSTKKLVKTFKNDKWEESRRTNSGKFKLLKVTIQATKLAKDKKKGNTGSNNIANNKLVKI